MKKIITAIFIIFVSFCVIKVNADSGYDYANVYLEYSNSEVVDYNWNMNELEEFVDRDGNVQIMIFIHEDQERKREFTSNRTSGVDQTEPTAKREALKEFLREGNSRVASTLSEYGDLISYMYIGEYSPIVTVRVNGGVDATHNFISIISKLDEIQSVYIIQEKNVSFATSSAFATSVTDIVSAQQNYDGDGIKVGIIDQGNVNDMDLPTFFGNNVIHRLSTEPDSNHTTLVAGIIGSLSGVAPEATLYITPEGRYDLDSNIGLLARDVNVINMSFVYSDTCSGPNNSNRSSTEIYLNYIVNNTDVSIVASTGNFLMNTDASLGYVCLPARAENVISVGSTNDNGRLSYYSNFMDDEDSSNPLVVAPGENISSAGQSGSGTSYSAPIVTGAIALLMEAKSGFKSSPQQVMAHIASTADPEKTDYSSITFTVGGVTRTFTNNMESQGLYEWAGAGLLNGKRLIDDRNHYVESYLPVTLAYNGEVNVHTVSLQAGETIHASLAFLRDAPWETSQWILSNYDLILTDANGNTVESSTSTTSNVERLEYTTTTAKTLYLKIRKKSNQTGQGEYGAVSYNIN